jgi:hypothetical protein
MNEDGFTYNCIFELIPTEQVTFFLLVTIFPLNFSFCLNFWSCGLILTQGSDTDPRACSRQLTASLDFIEFVSCKCSQRGRLFYRADN